MNVQLQKGWVWEDSPKVKAGYCGFTKASLQARFANTCWLHKPEINPVLLNLPVFGFRLKCGRVSKLCPERAHIFVTFGVMKMSFPCDFRGRGKARIWTDHDEREMLMDARGKYPLFHCTQTWNSYNRSMFGVFQMKWMPFVLWSLIGAVSLTNGQSWVIPAVMLPLKYIPLISPKFGRQNGPEPHSYSAGRDRRSSEVPFNLTRRMLQFPSNISMATG